VIRLGGNRDTLLGACARSSPPAASAINGRYRAPGGRGLTIWCGREPVLDAVWASFKKLQL
jgi:hypothetical protein